MSRNTKSETVDKELRGIASRIQERQGKSIRLAVEDGRDLTKAQGLLAKKGRAGGLTRWVKENFPFSMRTAYDRMSVFRFAKKAGLLSDEASDVLERFDLNAAVRLGQPDTPLAVCKSVVDIARARGFIKKSDVDRLSDEFSGKKFESDAPDASLEDDESSLELPSESEEPCEPSSEELAAYRDWTDSLEPDGNALLFDREGAEIRVKVNDSGVDICAALRELADDIERGTRPRILRPKKEQRHSPPLQKELNALQRREKNRVSELTAV